MDSLNPDSPIVAEPPVTSSPRVWKFWGTAFWGFVVFLGMVVGQFAVVAWFLLRHEGPIGWDTFGDAVTAVVSNGLTISLSVVTGLPAVLAALWIAIKLKRAGFADYLALRPFSWAHLEFGVAALFVLVMGWDALSRATGREVEPGFMGDVLKTARADNALWLLVLAFCVAAPITEELFARVQSLLKDLGPGFIRTHRGAAVALAAVEAVKPRGTGDAVVLLHGGAEVPCSRAHKAALKQALGQ